MTCIRGKNGNIKANSKVKKVLSKVENEKINYRVAHSKAAQKM